LRTNVNVKGTAESRAVFTFDYRFVLVPAGRITLGSRTQAAAVLLESDIWVPGESVRIRIDCLKKRLYLDTDLLVPGHLVFPQHSLVHFGLHLSAPQAKPEIPPTSDAGVPDSADDKNTMRKN
jgi:hypothetical protein